MGIGARQIGLDSFMRKAPLWPIFLISALALFAPPITDAQVVTDITSSGLNTQIDQNGNSYDIIGGTRPGGGPNLFHSFGNFSVGAGDTANFLNTPVDGSLPLTSNIISRVTGGNISSIYGTIQATDFGNANLFLMNPSGIMLGPGASLNVGGSVSFTTAQYIRLFDGIGSANFYANPANDGFANSILTIDPGAFTFLIASPAAYGFLTAPDSNATITVQGSALSVLSGQSLSLIGGNVVIEGGAQLSAPSGSIKLATAASPGEFDLNTLASLPNVEGTSFTSFGTINMAPGSSIDVHNTSTVWIKGGQLVLSVNDTTLSTLENPAPRDTVLLGPGSSIVTSNSGVDPGADVQITAGTVTLDGATITTETLGDGNSGNLTVNVGALALTNGAAITNNNFSFGFGQSGNLTVQGLAGLGSTADSITLDNFSQITTQTGVFGGGFGSSGDVNLTAAAMNLDGFGTGLTTQTFADGNSGNLTVNVGTLALTNGAAITSNNFSFGFGQSGNIAVQGLAGAGSHADSITLNNFSQIATQTFGFGPSGHVDLTAATIGLDGAMLTTGTFGEGVSGNITANVGTLSLTNGATISSTNLSPGFGQSGNLTVQGLAGSSSAANMVTLNSFSLITTDTLGPGPGGKINITAHTAEMDNLSAVQTTALDALRFGGGVGGDIGLNVGTLTLNNGAAIRTSDATSVDIDFDGVPDVPPGAGGNVTIQGIQGSGSAAESLVLSGGSLIQINSVDGHGGRLSIATTSMNLNGASAIISSTFGLGHGGDIDIGVQKASLTEGSTLESNTVIFAPPGEGVGGTIKVHGLNGQENMAESVTLTGFRSGIIADSFGSALPGDITVNAESVHLADGAVIEGGNTFSEGTGGNISITASTINVLSGSHISSQARALDAGAVTIIADQATLDTGAIVTSTISETGGRGGDVILNVGNLSLANGSSINSSTSQTGRAGDITITAQSATVASGSTIAASTSGSGDAGTISLLATGTSVNLTGGSSITSSTTAGGHAGQVIIATPTLNINNSSIATSTNSTGNAGSITAKANTVSLANGSQISSSSTGTATGSAGSITIEGLASPANTLTITDSALLTTAEDTGQGGSITVDATNLALKNATLSASVHHFDDSLSSTDAVDAGIGNIALSAKYMTMKGSHITAESLGTRNAGNISINSKTAPGKTFEMSNSQINTSASLADGGNIEIYFTDLIRLTNSTITSSVGNPTIKTTQGGNITIDPAYFILQEGQIRANAFAGTGGAIDITAGLFLADAASVIDASSTLGVSGTVQINSPINNLSNVVGRLPESLLAVQTLLRAACTARLAQGQTSSFVERGRDGIPGGPEGLLAAPYLPATSGHSARLRANPSVELSGIQLRQLPAKAFSPSIMILSENAVCSS